MHALQANLCKQGKLVQPCQPLPLLPRSDISSDIRARSSTSCSRSAGVLAGSSASKPGRVHHQHHLHPALKSPSRTRVMAAPEAQGVASTDSDLLVYGPGILGSYAGHLWKERVPGARVLGLTNTSNNHDRLKKMGLETATKDTVTPGKKYAHVLFSAPPSGSEDYVAEVKRALELWDPSHPSSSFVFTSSMSVCSIDDGGDVSDEHFPLQKLGKTPTVDRLLLAEQAVLQAGGNVVRLAGLYHTQRGAHAFMLRAKEIQRPGDYVVNLLHYEDAARLTVSVLAGDGSGPFRGRTFIGCDNHPMTFRDMVLACTQSGLFEGEVKWLVPDGECTGHAGKRCSNSSTRAALGGWAPKYSNFAEFMHSGAKDYYNTCGLF